jgi:hypothetical protein
MQSLQKHALEAKSITENQAKLEGISEKIKAIIKSKAGG